MVEQLGGGDEQIKDRINASGKSIRRLLMVWKICGMSLVDNVKR